MASYSFNPGSYRHSRLYLGYISGAGVNWATIHNSSGNTIGTRRITCMIHKSNAVTPGNWLQMLRSGFQFDTSSLNGLTVVSANIRIKFTTITDTIGNQYVGLYQFTPSAGEGVQWSSSNIVLADYLWPAHWNDVLLSNTTFQISSMSVGTEYTFPLNATGLARINVSGGYSSFGARIVADANNVEPVAGSNQLAYVQAFDNYSDIFLDVVTSGPNVGTKKGIDIANLSSAKGIDIANIATLKGVG